MTESTQTPTVHLVVLEGMPARPFDDLESELASSNIVFRRTVRSNTPYAALELFIPPAVIVALAVNSLFKAFFEEAGKAGYKALEGAIKKLSKRVLGDNGPDVELTGTPGKLPDVPRYSHRIGVIANFDGGTSIRLVFTPGEDPAPALTRFFELLNQLHGPDADNVTIAGDSGNGRHGLFVRYNADLDALVFINPLAGTPADTARDASSSSEVRKDEKPSL
ncbi:hypothetical protein [Luteibacter sp. UNCMF366Tsu5.1]|uniref:hypothetical protein n=1 Tax=Luteibacter sp. UNCMF366Tsu5.1 TaxID=1502758 RepID=UPI000908F79B|nr:hypothetical protein [Luteibacter sp. UNCMF366Tsu5.1]SFW29417.1 hypothetical protein SAMN02800691_0830 [Luteibacter sp. UNCMF366Tsu5.1]